MNKKLLLTPKRLETFVGGQVEIQNLVEEYVYRGEIAKMSVINQELAGLPNNVDLVIDLKWMAKKIDGKWVRDSNVPYIISLLIYSVSDIGDGRLSFDCWISSESATIFPKGGSKLDESLVIDQV